MNNTSRFKFYGILTALILVAVGVVWFYPREHSSKVPAAKKSAAITQANRPPPKPSAPSANASAWPKKDPNNPNIEIYNGFTVIRNMPATYILQSDAEWIIKDLKLDLTAEQLRDFATKYIAIVLERLKIESVHAQITKTSDNVYEINIPAYEEGKRLHDTVVNDINELLATAGKTKLVDSNEVILNNKNYNWGATPQKITIEYEGNDIYKIDHRFYSYLTVFDQNRYIEVEGSTEIKVKSEQFSDYYYIIRRINYPESLQTNNNPINPP